MSRTPTLLARVPKEDAVRIVCGIGHEVTAATVTATYQYRDMDGDPLPPFDVEEYDPPTCVVCGLRLWARVKACIAC